MTNSFPFNISVPASLADVKLTFYLSETMRLAGTKCATPSHTHNDWELRYVASGTGIQYIENKSIKIKSGDVLVIPPMTPHKQSEEASSEDLVQFSFRISVRKSDAPSVLAFEKILGSALKTHDDRFSLAHLFNRLWKEMTERKPGYFNYAQSLCLSIIIEHLRLTGQDTRAVFTTDGERYANLWRTKLDRFLYTRYKDNIKLEDLADEVALSPRHAARMIEKEYGVTFIEKLTEIRIDNAKYRLKSTKESMEAIASACGFQSYSYFTTCFKKNVGMTPGQYRSKFYGQN